MRPCVSGLLDVFLAGVGGLGELSGLPDLCTITLMGANLQWQHNNASATGITACNIGQAANKWRQLQTITETGLPIGSCPMQNMK